MGRIAWRTSETPAAIGARGSRELKANSVALLSIRGTRTVSLPRANSWVTVDVAGRYTSLATR